VYGIFINSAQLFFNSLMPVLGMGWDKMFTKKKAASGEKQ
jgi:hypothetical protein